MTMAQLQACIDLDKADAAAMMGAGGAPMSEAEQMLAGPVGTVEDLRVLQHMENRRRGVKPPQPEPARG